MTTDNDLLAVTAVLLGAHLELRQWVAQRALGDEYDEHDAEQLRATRRLVASQVLTHIQGVKNTGVGSSFLDGLRNAVDAWAADDTKPSGRIRFGVVPGGKSEP